MMEVLYNSERFDGRVEGVEPRKYGLIQEWFLFLLFSLKNDWLHIVLLESLCKF